MCAYQFSSSAPISSCSHHKVTLTPLACLGRHQGPGPRSLAPRTRIGIPCLSAAPLVLQRPQPAPLAGRLARLPSAVRPGTRGTSISCTLSPSPAASWRMGDLPPEEQLPRVLSIQSHVVHGYVGNKCAVLPLQLLGFEVDPVYSVQFSNHTGYPTFKGSVFDGAHLESLLDGLEANGLLPGYTHLLTGYIGSVSLCERIANVCQRLKQANGGKLTYVCDPVLGDEGRLYAPKDMIAAYRSTILPHASLLVPNQFEAELLAETGPITSVEDGINACDKLHQLGPHTVVITSMSLPEDTDHVTLVASTQLPQAAGPAAQRLTMRIPRIQAYFTGTGDLTAALLLAWTYRHPDNLQLAVEKAVAGLQAVLAATVKAAGSAVQATERTAEVCAARELRLVGNLGSICDPRPTLLCQRIGLSPVSPSTS